MSIGNGNIHPMEHLGKTNFFIPEMHSYWCRLASD